LNNIDKNSRGPVRSAPTFSQIINAIVCIFSVYPLMSF
jgi:hypothetical protein